MDGAGRLARSLRPQADLKAAAIGAVVLLREYLGLRPRAKKSTRKATLEREAPNRIVSTRHGTNIAVDGAHGARPMRGTGDRMCE